MRKLFFFLPILILIGLVFFACQQETNVVEPVGGSMTLYHQIESPVTFTCPDSGNINPTYPIGIIPVFVDGNTPVRNEYNVKIDPPTPGTYALGPGFVTFDIDTTDCGPVLNWSVTGPIQIDLVYMKGSNEYNKYDYTILNPRPKSDGYLHCPLAGKSYKYAGVSHVNFVWSYKLTINKTATASYERTYDWTIDKVGDESELTLSAGQTHTVNYDVKLDATYLDSDWKVTGKITIENNTPYAAVITSISDVLTGGINATYDCDVTLPYTLAAGVTLTCTYSADLTSATNGTNTVTVLTSTVNVGGDVATADYTFGDPTTEVDECIDVRDTYKGVLGTVCFAEAPKTFEYARDIVYNECGDFQVDNTASFITNDAKVEGSDSWTVKLTVDCGGGCTLTPGYWKTHSMYGPAPYDDNWAQLPDGANTSFFVSGQSYYQVLWTPPSGGNAYYILAHAYIAAKLNILNDASSTQAVNAAMAWAETFFNTYTPLLKLSKTVRDQAISYAGILDSYNNGYIGPGHCDE